MYTTDSPLGRMTLANPADTDRFEQQRQEKLSQIAAMGLDPYGSRYDDVEPAASVKARYRDGDESQRARSAGRIVLLRDIGKLIFITLRDRTGTIQVGLSKGLLTEQWPLAKLLDIGDIIGAAGKLGKTKTGEITIWVEEGGLKFLSKSLLQPPEKFHGLADVDQRYRQRYVDLWANPEVLDTLPAAQRDRGHDPPAAGLQGLPRSRDADDADHRRRGGGQTVHHAPQCLGFGALSPDFARAVPQAAPGRRDGAGVRDQPQLPQRGPQTGTTTPNSR